MTFDLEAVCAGGLFIRVAEHSVAWKTTLCLFCCWLAQTGFQWRLGGWKPSVLRWRSKGWTASPGLLGFLQISFNKPVLVNCGFPRSWFVQKPREVATISRRAPQEKGSESGGLLFLWKQNLLAEFFLQGMSQICVHGAVPTFLGTARKEASQHGALVRWGSGWVVPKSGQHGPPAPQGTWSKVRRHFQWLQLGRECYWRVVIGGQGWAKHPAMHTTASTAMNYPGQNVVSSTRVEKACFIH